MYITDVQVRSVVFQIEFTLEELNLIKKALENTTLELASFKEEEKDEISTALNNLYDLVNGAVDGGGNG